MMTTKIMNGKKIDDFIHKVLSTLNIDSLELEESCPEIMEELKIMFKNFINNDK